MKNACSRETAAAIAAFFAYKGWTWVSLAGSHCPTSREIQAEFAELLTTLGEGKTWASCGRLRVIKDPEWGITLCLEVAEILEEES